MTKATATALTNAIETAIANTTRIEAEAKAEREQLERALKLARGTAPDVSKAAATALVHVAAPPRSLPEQVESLLAVNTTMHEWQIAKSLSLSPEKTTALMRTLAREHKVYNLGSENHPRWCWVVGESISGAALKQHVLNLISATPLTHQQIEAATGVRRTRVSGALVQLGRDPAIKRRLENLGSERVHVHFVRPDKRG